MGLRPKAAQWFELLTDREHLAGVLECLAATGEVELQSHSQTLSPSVLPDLAPALEARAELAHRYGAYWPEPRCEAGLAGRDPQRLADQALDRLRAWARDAQPLVDELRRLEEERHAAMLLRDWLEASPSVPALDLLCRETGVCLSAVLMALPPGTRLPIMPPAVLVLPTPGAAVDYLLLVGSAEEVAVPREALLGQRGQVLRLPPGLPADAAAARQQLAERADALARDYEQTRARLAELDARHRLPDVLGEFEFLAWMAQHVPALPVTENFAWVTGWTSDPDGERLRTALEARALPGLLRLDAAPAGLAQPMVLANPSWVRPFEVFARLLGVPGVTEADPSRIVAIVAPLMFGYMFGDVGQGLVLLVAGLVLRRRWPALGLLVTGGLSAMAFGLAFGSVFALEHLFEPLWLHPLDEPIPVLVVALAFGAVLILTGLLLDVVGRYWAHSALQWWATEAGLLVAYLGLLAALFEPLALVAVAAGICWFMGGAVVTARRERWAALGEAFAHWIETLLQLVVNTLSFVRVGAFALAHAGLSVAVVGVAEAAGSRLGFAVILVLGNLLIMVLEGLVVGIQTTRLVLFEFFIRFLRSGGRPFRPLPRFNSIESRKRRDA